MMMMYRTKFLPKVGLIFALLVTIFLILASGILSYRNSTAQTNATEAVIRTQNIITALNLIETTMVDAETGQRGYLLTGEKEFLEPYWAAAGIAQVDAIRRPRIDNQLQSVRMMVSPGSAEHVLLERVRALIIKKMAVLHKTIKLYDEGAVAEALATVREGQGKRVMDTLRMTLSNLRTELARNLEEGVRIRNIAARNAHVSSVAACLASLVAIGVLAAAVRRYENSLIRERNRAEMLADHISQHAWTLDPEGRFEWFNLRWREYTGFTEGDLDQQWRAVVDHPVHRDRIHRGLSHAVATGKPWQDIFPLRACNGSWRWFMARAVPIRGSDGKIKRWFGTNTDIDERWHLEQELKEGNLRRDEFIATLAHELRNPLAPIQSGLEIMRIHPSIPKQLNNVHEIMGRQLKHLVRLIDDLLDVTRISTGKLSLVRQILSVHAVIHNALEACQSRIDSSAHTIDICLPAEPITIDADPERLAQIFINLLNNAVKYTPDGGLIRLVVECEHNEVVISVIDSGIGIDPTLLPYIFDLFSQAPSSTLRRQDGIGIGLAIARKLVELHGGNISAKSDGLGQGSCFIVRLPLTHEVIKTDANSTPIYNSTSGVLLRRILILDDNIDAAKTLSALFNVMGHQTRLAHSGQAAITLAKTYEPQFAFLDIGLPDMSGYDVAREIRSIPKLRNVKLIALTGWGAAQDRAKSVEAGFDVHLTKPVSLEILKEKFPETFF